MRWYPPKIAVSRQAAAYFSTDRTRREGLLSEPNPLRSAITACLPLRTATRRFDRGQGRRCSWVLLP